jgi:hypothetical protein
MNDLDLLRLLSYLASKYPNLHCSVLQDVTFKISNGEVWNLKKAILLKHPKPLTLLQTNQTYIYRASSNDNLFKMLSLVDIDPEETPYIPWHEKEIWLEFEGNLEEVVENYDYFLTSSRLKTSKDRKKVQILK